MKITINDQPYEVAEGATLQSIVVARMGDKQTGFAVAVNQEVIARTDHDRHYLRANDSILIIQATQGG
jgi:sulfur carrier protein